MKDKIKNDVQYKTGSSSKIRNNSDFQILKLFPIEVKELELSLILRSTL